MVTMIRMGMINGLYFLSIGIDIYWEFLSGMTTTRIDLRMLSGR